MTFVGGRVRRHLTEIFWAAVDAVDPGKLVRDRLISRDRWVVVRDGRRECARWRGRTLVVGAGKAAARMAAGCEVALGPGNVFGFVIVADGCGVPVEAVAVAEAGHPVPDRRGEEATRRLCGLLSTRPELPTLCLISGGASSLLVQPRPPVSVADKMATTELLLSSGADIHQVNTVRKHLSQVKGGGLLRLAVARPMVTLILSDVIGDDPSVVGSGPTAADPSTFGDAQRILERFELARRVPESVRTLLARGVEGAVSETVKNGDRLCIGVSNVVVGSIRLALAAAAQRARDLGYELVVSEDPLAGDSVTAAQRWGAEVKDTLGPAGGGPSCLITGGETTVQVRGAGRGGRNQEFALALAPELSGSPISVLSAGTDGIDGPTDAAGAFVDGTSIARARAIPLGWREALEANDSYTFFDELGDLFRCGPTGTNVMDIKIALREP